MVWNTKAQIQEVFPGISPNLFPQRHFQAAEQTTPAADLTLFPGISKYQNSGGMGFICHISG